MQSAILVLADGSIFKGKMIGAEGHTCGELVFNTAMTGYQEIMTDPSYHGQIVTLTYPHIGNTGINDLDVESGSVHIAGLVVRDYPKTYSSWRAQGSLGDYLKAHNIIGIADIDTRELTRRLRTTGAQNACIMAGVHLDEAKALEMAKAHPSMSGQALAEKLSIQTTTPYSQEGVYQLTRNAYAKETGDYHVVAYDFGIKRNILRILAHMGCRITLVPANTSAEDALALNPDGIFLSNGPGDPEPLKVQIQAIQTFLDKRIPLFGICLGQQLLGLAAGSRTLKMKFGHHGANHPVVDVKTGRVMITSQNHGFCVDESALPENVEVTHESLFDGSLQGIAWKDRPAFSFQGHPEASPGPNDAQVLFARFIEAMKQAKA